VIGFFAMAPVFDITTAYTPRYNDLVYGIIAVYCIDLYFIVTRDGA
jgi:hypothetical protein